jgi:hypothetical protein
MAIVWAASMTPSTDAHAARRVVTLGEVSAPGAEAAQTTRFRTIVKEELGALDLERARSREHFVLSASLVRLEALASKDQGEASCVVSVSLRRRTGGALVAILRGSARAQVAEDEVDGDNEPVVRAAVRSALGRLPEVVRAKQ